METVILEREQKIANFSTSYYLLLDRSMREFLTGSKKMIPQAQEIHLKMIKRDGKNIVEFSIQWKPGMAIEKVS